MAEFFFMHDNVIGGHAVGRDRRLVAVNPTSPYFCVEQYDQIVVGGRRRNVPQRAIVRFQT